MRQCRAIILKRIRGGCTAPIGAFAEINNDVISLTGHISSFDGKKHITNQTASQYNNSDKLGITLAKQMLRDGGDKILSGGKRKMIENEVNVLLTNEGETSGFNKLKGTWLFRIPFSL